MKKSKMLSLVLVMSLLGSLFVGVLPVSATAITQGDAADVLYSLGLFRGTGTDADGNPVYDLEGVPTRGHAIVMLVRFLGAESKAETKKLTHPFDDVPTWAEMHIGYAYANGLANGINTNRFGTNLDVLPIMYITFVLRALGYSDNGEDADFSYHDAVSFARSIGLTEEDYSDGFVRGDMVMVSYAALNLPMKDSDSTLIQSLVYGGVVNEHKAKNAGFDVELEVRIPVEHRAESDGYWEYNRISFRATDILAAFPTASVYTYTDIPNDHSTYAFIYTSETYSEKEMVFLHSLYLGFGQRDWGIGKTLDFSILSLDDASAYIFIMDSKNRILGTFSAKGQDFADDQAVFTRGGGGVDGAALYNTVETRMDQVMRTYDGAVITIGDGFDPTDRKEGYRISRIHPVYVDGVQIGSNHGLTGINTNIDPGLKWTGDDIYWDMYNSMYRHLFLSSGLSFAEPYVSTSGEIRYGVRLQEQLDNETVLYWVYDESGSVLGHIIIPPVE